MNAKLLKWGDKMFLNELPKNLIKPYLDIAYTLIAADGNFSDEEMATLQMYKTEFNLDNLPELSFVDVSSALTVFEYLTNSEKKKIYFELFSLSYVDSNCSAEERELLNVVLKEFHISESEAKELERITIKLLFDYEQLGIIINS